LLKAVSEAGLSRSFSERKREKAVRQIDGTVHEGVEAHDLVGRQTAGIDKPAGKLTHRPILKPDIPQYLMSALSRPSWKVSAKFRILDSRYPASRCGDACSVSPISRMARAFAFGCS
jgi:hypothetical protein